MIGDFDLDGRLCKRIMLIKEWSKELFRGTIRKLDEKTGLNGADLEIVLFSGRRSLGYYSHGASNSFGFNLTFFNNASINIAGKFDMIRHEYAHYYDHTTKLDAYVIRSRREKTHGADWRFACCMLNANPRRCYNATLYKDINWSGKEIEARYNADDVKKLDIRLFLNRWNPVPLDDEISGKISSRIKTHNPDGYYDVGNIIEHPVRGYGIVLETIPCVDVTQKIYVRFDDKTDGVFCSKDLWKITDGIAVPYGRGGCNKS